CNLPAQTLLTRLFHDEQVRMFESEPVAFRCTCSRTRIARTLAAIGHAHLDGLADERGELEVTCEFCNRSYRFDRVDVEHALTEGVHIDSPDRVQ
ncbi:MAG: Hsp33 family molecular chaperone HslO, partial [Phycisphaerales bacterium]|nr:Hsp33 family molecular chaperone HslO [Phycisphaerales bacterium]